MTRINKAQDIRINTQDDEMTRTSMQQIKDTLGLINVEIEWKNIEFSYKTGDPGEYKNPLQIIPTDVILTWIEWESTPGVFTWEYSKSTKDTLYFTCTQNASKIRAMVGRRG